MNELNNKWCQCCQPKLTTIFPCHNIQVYSISLFIAKLIFVRHISCNNSDGRLIYPQLLYPCIPGYSIILLSKWIRVSDAAYNLNKKLSQIQLFLKSSLLYYKWEEKRVNLWKKRYVYGQKSIFFILFLDNGKKTK